MEEPFGDVRWRILQTGMLKFIDERSMCATAHGLTTNAIESMHMQLRKIVKNRGHFPSVGCMGSDSDPIYAGFDPYIVQSPGFVQRNVSPPHPCPWPHLLSLLGGGFTLPI